MELRSARNIEELQEVLEIPTANGPHTAYWVFSNVSGGKWENMTITSQGKYGREFPKTYGHYHTTSDKTEIYRLVSGKGIFLLQEKHVNEGGEIVPNKVGEVFLVKAENPGDEIMVPNDYGHSWSNVGKEPLITFDNWKWKHLPTDYKPIRKLRGLVYYIVEENGDIKLIPNPNYIEHPEPKWLTPKEFADRNKISSIV